MKRPTVTCSQCHGSGEAPLSDALYEALAVVRTHPGITAPEVFKQIVAHEGYVPHVTAINNRLQCLYDLALVSRERWGKAWKYTVNNPQ